ncbi:MAG TPA: acetyl-CoA C-acyltransferase [Tepidisphaeraceae bacterium]|nr:acetyl-CoA C-acyltransferase [Tepidisphaeraceae bacterium]
MPTALPMTDVVLAGPARTPIGTFLGALAEMTAPALGAVAARESLGRANVNPADVDEAIIGNVLSAGVGQNCARQVARGAGLPDECGATTVNKVCGSGLKAVMLAAQAIRCGDARVVLAGGTESMSRSPYLLQRARTGLRMGHAQLVDSMLHDGLTDAYGDFHMGTCGDACAAHYQFTREQQNAFAIASYTRAIEAQSKGWFADEIVPVDVSTGKTTARVADDEQPKRFDEAKLRKLRPAFGETGTVTAGNASGISDGAATILVMSAARARELGVRPVARVLGYATAAREPAWFTTAPIGAMRRLLESLSLTVGDVDLFEINEAFAVVPMAAMRDLEIPHDKVNVTGGAVALGHPIGASGCRVLVTLLNALEKRDKRVGVASLCIGGGEAVAVAVERL